MKVLRRKRAIVLFALFVTYASFFLCRSNVDAALPLLSRAYGYDKEQLGRLSSIAILGYAAGKVSLGPLGDIVGGRRLMLVSIIGSVAASICFGMSTSLAALTVFAVVNRWFQSGGWAGVVHVSSREFVPTEHGSVMGAISTSYEIGSVVSLLFCGLLVEEGLSWRGLFIVNPLLLLTVGFAMTRVIRRATLPRDDVGTRPVEQLETGGPHAEESIVRRAAWLASLRPFGSPCRFRFCSRSFAPVS
jgi:sugar phosphate permease